MSKTMSKTKVSLKLDRNLKAVQNNLKKNNLKLIVKMMTSGMKTTKHRPKWILMSISLRIKC